mmetsp:Transcript_31769/g.71435  ORF Transcript_31769/g.71435 Transcript_31769/m.71435 type:complete len:209 (-) Transcript_31769:367-993(-)
MYRVVGVLKYAILLPSAREFFPTSLFLKAMFVSRPTEIFPRFSLDCIALNMEEIVPHLLRSFEQIILKSESTMCGFCFDRQRRSFPITTARFNLMFSYFDSKTGWGSTACQEKCRTKSLIYMTESIKLLSEAASCTILSGSISLSFKNLIPLPTSFSDIELLPSRSQQTINSSTWSNISAKIFFALSVSRRDDFWFLSLGTFIPLARM